VLSGFSVSAQSDCKDKDNKGRPYYNILKVVVHKNVLQQLFSMQISGSKLRGSLKEFEAEFIQIPSNQIFSLSNKNLCQFIFFCKCDYVYEALGKLLQFIFQANGMLRISSILQYII